MRRRYNLITYEELILKLKNEIPQIAIGVDVIVGFPGETARNFENTFQFIDKLPVSYLHVFSYSERRNTHAVGLPGKVDVTTRKKYSSILRELSIKKKHEFYKVNCGAVHHVLFETLKNNGYIFGFTDNYIKVRAQGTKDFENNILPVKLTEPEDSKYCKAETVNN
jgi:threonylcarbamoyladenosine tRNA methylthiotransferase MtaB